MHPTERARHTWRPPRDAAWRGVSALALLCIVAWVLPALLMAHRGFSVSDEGTYAVTYRDWASATYFESGAQYFYGPIYHWLGESIAWLRVVRVAMALGANFFFAVSFVSWLRTVRPNQISESGRNALVLLLTASGSPIYCIFIPLTPGYYDLTVDVALCLAAVVCLTARDALRKKRTRFVLGILTGSLAVIVILAKWPAIVAIFAVEVSVYAILKNQENGRYLRHLGGVIAGTTLTIAVMQFLMFSVVDALEVLAHITRVRSGTGGGPGSLLLWYVTDTAIVAFSGLLFALPPLLIMTVAMSKHFGGTAASKGWYVLPVAVSAAALPLLAGWRGGGAHGRAAIAAIIAALLMAFVAWALNLAHAPWRTLQNCEHSTFYVPFTLAILPILQGLGASIPLLYSALACMALWVSLAIIFASGPVWRPPMRWMTWTSIAACICVAAALGGSTTLLTPFKTSGFSASTETLTGVSELQVSRELAAQSLALKRALAPYVQGTSRTQYYTLDQLNGYVYILGGKVIGSPYTSASAPERSADILAFACRRGDVDFSRPPILLLNRVIDPASSDALAGCGFAFPQTYREIPIPGGPDGVTAWVPRRP